MSSKRERAIKEAKLKVFAKWRHDETCTSKKKNAFTPLPHTLLMHDNFIRLRPNAMRLYIYMTDYANGQQETAFPKSIYEKITTKQTFQNSIEQLEDFGFIEIIKKGKPTRTENIYKFSDKWKRIIFSEKEKRKTHINDKYIK